MSSTLLPTTAEVNLAKFSDIIDNFCLSTWQPVDSGEFWGILGNSGEYWGILGELGNQSEAS